MKTGAVITAAGRHEREGEFKPLKKMGAISVAERIIATFQQAGVFPIVVITGYRAAELEKQLSRLGAVCLRNEAYETTQMLDSAKLGFSFIKEQCSRTFFTPVDVPLFTRDTVYRMMAAKAPVVKPVCEGRGGHPVLLSCSLLPDICAYDGPGGLRQAINTCCEEIDFVPVEDTGVLLREADAAADAEGGLVEQHSKQLLRPIWSLSLMREGKLFDENGALLLHMLAYTGTVKGACEKLGISYSKAWKLIAALEENLGFALIERQPGGEYGGGSHLTAQGQTLLQAYEEYTAKVRQYANDTFSNYFPIEN
ncbi:MAG: NTP transferase domain-containing protein [Eubacteriales bacterium]|nr:NTP transferase domain-containing protein [Eubacteriales bacterium]